MILVVGATGQLGQMIVERLLDSGREVRALVRSGTAHQALTAAGATAVAGDLKDAESLRAACSGVDAVITTANSSARGGADTVESVDRWGNRNLIDAAVSAGVRHFVFVSALGASADHPMPFLRAKGESEDHLRASGMTWTVLQPNLYMDKLPMAVVGEPAMAGGPVVLVGEGRRPHSIVAARDVARYAVVALDHDSAVGQTLMIGGPEPVTWYDVVEAFEQELGRTLDVHTVPADQPVPGMPEIVFQLLSGLEVYDSPLDPSALVMKYGVTPTTLSQFAHDYVAQARQVAG
jgi:uncharacterized protein YbjT (DUF2867 family)